MVVSKYFYHCDVPYIRRKKEKLHASNLNLFEVGVYALVLRGAYLLIHRN